MKCIDFENQCRSKCNRKEEISCIGLNLRNSNGAKKFGGIKDDYQQMCDKMRKFKIQASVHCQPLKGCTKQDTVIVCTFFYLNHQTTDKRKNTTSLIFTENKLQQNLLNM